jgi:uridine kinase
MSPPLLVAIVGGSGSGKTWLAAALQAALAPKAARLSLDDFYLDHSRLSPARCAKLNFDHPRAIDWPGFEQVLLQLLAVRPARLPCYDFKTHCRLPSIRLLKPKPLILVDGLWLLRRPSLRRLFTLSIFLDCPARTRLRRRLARDLRSRGRTRASIREQFRTTVEPMHRRYVAPQARRADIVLAGHFGRRDIKKLKARLRALL